MSAIAIGVAALLVMVAVGEGAERALLGRIDAMGRNLLIVTAERVPPLIGRTSGPAIATTLTPGDAVAIRAHALDVALAAPSVDFPRRVRFERLSRVVTIRATSRDYEEIRDFRTARGRYFTREEARRRARVAVFGAAVADVLFDGRDPVGTTVRIGGIPFEVVGVLESKGSSLNGGSDEDDQILIPLETGLRRVFNVDYVTLLYVRVRDGDRLDAARRSIEELLRERHDLPRLDRPDDFRVQNQMALLEAERETSASFRRLVTALASVALLVGGVGILSTMMLSIRERRNEIGLRMAVGGRRRDIRAQFLVETLLVGGGGALLGLGLGVAAAAVVSRATEWQAAVTPAAFGWSVGAALAISLIFGVLPARRAAALDPVESLRAE